MDKASLRSVYAAKRKQLNPDEVRQLNEGLVQQFASLSLNRIRLIHVFYPIPGKIEADTLPLVDYLRRHHPEIQLALPKSNLETHTLSHILWKTGTPLAMNRWGITEPEHGEEVRAEEIDLVLVPLLACDLQGNRVGYGKGFYDRFLASCKQETLKVGLSWFAPEPQIDDADPHDVALDLCITPVKIYRFPSV